MPGVRIAATTAVLIALACATGCATITTHAPQAGKPPDGVRVYPPKLYLLVDTCAKQTRILSAPDFANAYDVKPLTLLSRQDFSVELEEGQLTKLVANQDTTALLTFVQGAAETAARAAGVGVSSQAVEGTFGLDDGVWTLDALGSPAPLLTRPNRRCP
jgi:hypothetical protein